MYWQLLGIHFADLSLVQLQTNSRMTPYRVLHKYKCIKTVFRFALYSPAGKLVRTSVAVVPQFVSSLVLPDAAAD